jgi:NitT/TauT family transport system permease protein
MANDTTTAPAVSASEQADRPVLRPNRINLPQLVLPILVVGAAIAGWEIWVRLAGVPEYLLPGPLSIINALARHWGTLQVSLWVTLKTTFLALGAAIVLGGLLAIVFTLSRWVEYSFFPIAVVMQVTPIVAIAPLIIIWANDTLLAMLICAWLVAFFPILSNTALGLQSADHNLLNLFQLYGASRWQLLRFLRIPAAMPYFLGGLRISGGLALIGAIVAEFVAGTGGVGSGLAYRILEAGYNIQIPRMFAALLLISAAGICIFLLLSLVSHLALRRWHESAVKREN